MYWTDEVEKKLNEVKEIVQEQENKLAQVQLTLAHWRTDKEIKTCEEEIKKLRTHSLLQLTDKELKDISDFKDKHYNKHPKKNLSSTYIYSIGNSGIGHIITVKCPICNEELEVTDIDAW